MSKATDQSPLTLSEKKYLEEQKEFSVLFKVFVGFFFLLNLVSVIAPSLPNVIIGIIIYRGLHRRFAAKTILKYPSLTNGKLYRKTVWGFTWKTFLAFLLIPATITTLVEPDTRKGEALGLYIAYFIVCYACSADRAFWLIKKFRNISTEPVKIKTASGLSPNQKILRNALIVLMVLFGIIYLGANSNKPNDGAEPKPLPPTRTEEMQQRLMENTRKTGDSRMQKVVEQNVEKYRALEMASAKLIAACEKINGDVIFEPHKSNPEKVSHEIQILAEMKQSAIKVNEELSVFEETTKQEISKKFSDSPETVRSEIDKSQEGKVLFKKWTHDAIQLTQACTRHLEFFQDTGKIDQALQLAAAQSAVKFEETAKKLDERNQSNFNKMEATMPR